MAAGRASSRRNRDIKMQETDRRRHGFKACRAGAKDSSTVLNRPEERHFSLRYRYRYRRPSISMGPRDISKEI